VEAIIEPAIETIAELSRLGVVRVGVEIAHAAGQVVKGGSVVELAGIGGEGQGELRRALRPNGQPQAPLG
jgi:hypothetical protein